MSEYDRKIWQEEQAARDSALEAQREKWAKTRARSAKNAQRKLERLRLKLSESGELSDWEDEFSSSVTERLEKFGSAFHDPEKGRPADALSFAQKKVVAALKKKAKGPKRSQSESEEDQRGKPIKARKTSSFKTKKNGFNNKGYVPKVRQIEDDLPEEEDEPFIPEYKDEAPKRPFLRIVK